jgi:tRNA(Ile)-lysidine synthase
MKHEMRAKPVTAPIASNEARAAFAALTRFPSLALAVSGGADSVALLHLVAQWRAANAGSPNVTVLTVDHGLRADSGAEAAMVARLAVRVGLPHAVLNWSPGERPSSGVQARAREARYDLMAAYCHAQDIPALVTAHHLDDQAETFLMRLKRGSGLDGLAAIPEESTWSGIAVLRPLLDMPKARLVATLSTAGLGWAEDPSNRDERFERARLRSDRDALARLGLTPEALARSARRLRRARAALEGAADAVLAASAALSEAGYCLLDRQALAEAPEEIGLRVLARAVAAVSGRETPIQLAKLETLYASLDEHPDKAHTLGGCRLQTVAGRLGIFRETRGSGLPSLRLVPGERALWDRRFTVELAKNARTPIAVAALGEAHWRELRGRSSWLESLPRFAAATLPACFAGEEIVLPRLSHNAPGQAGGNVTFRARFVASTWSPRRPRAFERRH